MTTGRVRAANVAGMLTMRGQGLPAPRGSAVSAKFDKDGMPASRIASHGFDTTRLLIPTSQILREPQHRRVENRRTSQ